MMLAMGAAGQTWTADNGNGTYTNPLFFDEFSDPDLIRVGREFYLTGTTMHSMPGLPVLRSRDLVNWEFVSYAAERLDLGPEYRLEGGRNVYGQGIWAPCFRYFRGTYYIFSNVNGKTTQLFRAKRPEGPWTRTAMKRSLHDLSVLFEEDGSAWVVWGYRGIRLARLTEDLTDVVAGTEREVIAPGAGMGEGLHLYRIGGKYYLTSAWFQGEMRMPTARAEKLEGPWEVNQDVSRGEDFGLAPGARLGRVARGAGAPYPVVAGDRKARGRLAIHQGGIVDTAQGEWWGFSMMDANSVGRLTALSPVTWKDGWPYFGLEGNLGRSPRVWVKPATGVKEKARAPYRRSDDFGGRRLQPVWQWNHVPVDGQWWLGARKGYLRLRALGARGLWDARNTLTQRAMGPRQRVTAVLEADGLKEGDVAGLALFNRPYAWVGVERKGGGLEVVQFDEQTGRRARAGLRRQRVWLRAECDFLTEKARFSWSEDGRRFEGLGEEMQMVYQLTTFQGVRNALFAWHAGEGEGGYADFDGVEVKEEAKRGIPLGRRVEVREVSTGQVLGAGLKVEDAGLGRVRLRGKEGLVRVEGEETFQWIETFTGDLTLMGLQGHRYVRWDGAAGVWRADAAGPRPDGEDGVRLGWR